VSDSPNSAESDFFDRICCGACGREMRARDSYRSARGPLCASCHTDREAHEAAVHDAAEMGVSLGSRRCPECASPTMHPIEIRQHAMRVNHAPIPTGTSVRYSCTSCGKTVRVHGPLGCVLGVLVGLVCAGYFSRLPSEPLLSWGLVAVGAAMVLVNAYWLLGHFRYPLVREQS
jgi:hypothetical protein